MQGIARFNRLLDALPPRCREVVWLCQIEGKNHRQVAMELQITLRNVECLMNQSLKLLKYAKEW
jgi:DNA-directed RNA polymerase specialized sigma24 family protein